MSTRAGDGPIFHIAAGADWRRARRVYRPAVYDRDGFVHCSRGDQVMRVAEARFAGRSGLVLLAIDPGLVGCELRHENLEGGSELFPHLYGPVPVAAVTAVAPLRLGPDGCFVVPSDFARRFRVAPR